MRSSIPNVRPILSFPRSFKKTKPFSFAVCRCVYCSAPLPSPAFPLHAGDDRDAFSTPYIQKQWRRIRKAAKYSCRFSNAVDTDKKRPSRLTRAFSSGRACEGDQEEKRICSEQRKLSLIFAYIISLMEGEKTHLFQQRHAKITKYGCSTAINRSLHRTERLSAG